MADKLYSRPRIRFNLFKWIRKISSLKVVLLIFLVTILIFFTMFFKFAYPIFKSSCETTAHSKCIKIVNDDVNNVIKDYPYNSLVKIEKDVNGKISYIEADSKIINELVSKIVSDIQNDFDQIPRINVFINFGSISGISMLSNIEPKFTVELESAGNIQAKVKTEFESVGINQTHHKIYLEVKSKIGILTPFGSFGNDVDTDVLLAEAVIVGEVPESFLEMDKAK